jgi:hypothetical protein
MAAIRLKKFHGAGCGKARNNAREKFDSDRISLQAEKWKCEQRAVTTGK